MWKCGGVLCVKRDLFYWNFENMYKSKHSHCTKVLSPLKHTHVQCILVVLSTAIGFASLIDFQNAYSGNYLFVLKKKDPVQTISRTRGTLSVQFYLIANQALQLIEKFKSILSYFPSTAFLKNTPNTKETKKRSKHSSVLTLLLVQRGLHVLASYGYLLYVRRHNLFACFDECCRFGKSSESSGYMCIALEVFMGLPDCDY